MLACMHIMIQSLCLAVQLQSIMPYSWFLSQLRKFFEFQNGMNDNWTELLINL
jgi:hypothetical protein